MLTEGGRRMGAQIVRLPRQYRRMPPDAFTRRWRRIDVIPDGNGAWAVHEMTEHSGAVLATDLCRSHALMLGALYADIWRADLHHELQVVP